MDSRQARLQLSHEGRVAHVLLAAPRANVLNRDMIGDLLRIFAQLSSDVRLQVIVVTGEGPNFSYGASVEEHLPEQIEATLKHLHSLLIAVANAPAPTIAAVRGQCLGGGFELALACDLVLAEETAKLGCPEIKLGVFPPAASALLPGKIGSAWSSRIVLTGHSFSGKELAACGLISRLAAPGDLDAELERWLASDFLPRSAAALRHASAAARLQTRRALEQDLPAIEEIYVGRLMKEPGAEEGIRAFLEKREPQWNTSEIPARAGTKTG